jgi:hypothetical protein
MKKGRIITLLILAIALISCSSKNSLGGLIKLLPESIYNFRTFFGAFIIVFGIRLIAAFLLGSVGCRDVITLNLISLGLFIYILIVRDYGFFLTLLIFIADIIVFMLGSYLWKKKE